MELLLSEDQEVSTGIASGGGSNEIQRNIISERVLGMPREYAAEVPYSDVRRGPSSSTRSSTK